MTLLFVGASCDDQLFTKSRITAVGQLNDVSTKNAAVIANMNAASWPEGRSVVMRNMQPQKYSLLYNTTSVDFSAPETWSAPANLDDVTVYTTGLAALRLNRIDPVSGSTFQEDGITLRPNGASVYLALFNDVNPDNALEYAYADNNVHADVYVPHGADGPVFTSPKPVEYKKMSVDGRSAVWVEYTDPSQKDATYIDVLIDAGNKTYLTVQLHFGNGENAAKIHDELNQLISGLTIQTS